MASPLKLLDKFEFHSSLIANGERKYIFCTGHMTNMVAMSIHGKNLKQSSSPEPLGPLP